MRNISNCVQEIKTHILCPMSFFRNSCRLRDYVEEYCKEMLALTTTWHMRNASWITKVTRRLTICITYRFSSATIAAKTRLNIRLYSHCLSCQVCLCYVYVPVQQIRNTWEVLKCGAGEGWRRSVGPIM